MVENKDLPSQRSSAPTLRVGGEKQLNRRDAEIAAEIRRERNFQPLIRITRADIESVSGKLQFAAPGGNGRQTEVCRTFCHKSNLEWL